MKNKQYKPTFNYEIQMWNKGYKLVIGVDEVGRGSFAGPVVAAACAFGPEMSEEYLVSCGVNDSKQVKFRDRDRLALEIPKLAKSHAIAGVNVSFINRAGIVKATEKAVRKAVSKILYHGSGSRKNSSKKKLLGNVAAKTACKTVFLLTDAFPVKYVSGIGLSHQLAIKKGDNKCLSIAAASILAKVYRDRLMMRLSRLYPQYGWGRNKGYGTREHREAIIRYGMTRYHRTRFVETWRKKTKYGSVELPRCYTYNTSEVL